MGHGQRLALAATLVVALLLGFVEPAGPVDTHQLHIFLCNLCFGGAILLWSAGGCRPTRVVPWWLALSAGYALSASLEAYDATLLLSVPLMLLVETTRTSRFPLLPLDLLRPGDLAARFLHTALACLSLALASCSLVIVHDHFLHGWHHGRLDLDTFFLFFSFPISLAVFAAVFSRVPDLPRDRAEIAYWGITGGVVAFFLAIVLANRALEMLAGSTLLVVIAMITTTFSRRSAPSQERALLLSGLGFLVGAGLTGVGYIAAHIWPDRAPSKEFVLMLHGTLALYGWNLAGLIVILNGGQFPIVRRIGALIALHWVTILVLVPLGTVHPRMALVAAPAFTILVALSIARTPRARITGTPSTSVESAAAARRPDRAAATRG